MVTISNSYSIDWLLKDNPNYGVTNKGLIINLKRGTILKKTMVGYSKGYYIEGKFKTLSKLRKVLIKKDFCPFK